MKEQTPGYDRRVSNNKRIAEHIFNGSITLAGVCVTIIALFRVMKVGVGTYADEILAANTCIFIASSLLAYISLKKKRIIPLKRLPTCSFLPAFP